MQSRTIYSVSDILDGGDIRRGYGVIVGLCFLLMICDSYDVSALSFAAPSLIRGWAIAPSVMGMLFSTGLFGLLVGSIAIGRLGDRIGRKRALVLGALFFSSMTLATAAAASVPSLFVLRFLAAIGLGGAVPNAIALTAEMSPSRRRIMSVGLIFSGYSIGGIVAGVSAAYLVPHLGWRAIFVVGGAMSFAITALLALFMPESLSFLAARPDRQAASTRLALWLRRDLRAHPGIVVMPGDRAGRPAVRLSELFAGRLASITTIIWILYVTNSISVFSLSSWMPVAVQAIGLPPHDSILATTLLFLGSALGGVVGGRFADRYGVLAVMLMAVAAFPSVVAIGSMAGGVDGLLVASFLAGCFAFGSQTCLHGVVSTVYPASMRSNGVGWALGVGKLGSIVGPLVGGFLMGRLTSQQLFLAVGFPVLLVAGLSGVLHLLLKARTAAGQASNADAGNGEPTGLSRESAG